MALLATPVALWLWIFALDRATPTRVASTMAMHPISASILAAVIVGEPIGLDLAVGVVAVLAGICHRGASAGGAGDQTCVNVSAS